MVWLSPYLPDSINSPLQGHESDENHTDQPAILSCATLASAEEKTALTEAAEAMKPIIEVPANYVQKSIMQSLANGKGPMAEGSRKNLEMQAQRKKEANRGVRRSMKECIKPGNVIDDDVKECTEALREKTWQRRLIHLRKTGQMPHTTYLHEISRTLR